MTSSATPAMGDYQELKQLTLRGIRCVAQPQAAAAIAELAGADTEPSRSLDLALWDAAQADPDPLPLLCLRCRISHAFETWLQVTYKAHHKTTGIELAAMASYALDDDGKLAIRIGPSEKAPFTYAQIASLPSGLTRPFSAEVLRSYNPALSGLPHWAKLKIQAHNELKAYFRQHGLLLISDWALLYDTSPTRVRRACQQHLKSSDTIETLCALHSRYGPLYVADKLVYKQKTGKASGWQPDLPFLRELAPDEDPFTTSDRLKAIAQAIRRFLTVKANLSLDQVAEAGFEAVDPASLSSPAEDDGPSAQELKALIDAALQRAMDEHMPQVLARKGINPDRLRCYWAGWLQGITQRDISKRCGGSQSDVSKKLRPEEQASAIATAAAVELKRHPAFASCGQSVEAAERLVNALRNHLLKPEQEGDVAPLRRWVQNHLSQS